MKAPKEDNQLIITQKNSLIKKPVGYPVIYQHFIKLKVSLLTQKCWSLVPIIIRINQDHTVTLCSFKFPFNIIPPLRLCLPEVLNTPGLRTKTTISLRFCEFFILIHCSLHLPWFYHPNIISPCFTPFCLNASCKFIPLLNLRFLIFGLTPVGWLHSITPTSSFVCKYNSWFTPFLFTPTFSVRRLGVKQGLVVYLAVHYAVFPHLPVATSIWYTKVLLSPLYWSKTKLHFSIRFGGGGSLSRITRGDNISYFYTFHLCSEKESMKSTQLKVSEYSMHLISLQFAGFEFLQHDS